MEFGDFLRLVVEVLGYIGSLTVAVSLMLRTFIKLRILNMAGAFILVIYCLIVNAWPLLFLNAFITLVNGFYIYQYYTKKEFFRICEIKHDSAFLREFLHFYKDDIVKYFPNFESKYNEETQCFYLLRNMVPACMLIIRKMEDTAEIILDYATKEYRDNKIGDFIFNDNAKHFVNMGINRFYFEKPDKKHIKYLETIGFVKNESTNDEYVKELSKLW